MLNKITEYFAHKKIKHAQLTELHGSKWLPMHDS